MTITASNNGQRTITFEDLMGLRAGAYVRDSTLDQRKGFRPEIQRRNIQRFAESYGLVLGDCWYTEFVSGRNVEKRSQFHQFIQDAHVDRYDVLLSAAATGPGRGSRRSLDRQRMPPRPWREVLRQVFERIDRLHPAPG